MVPKFNITRSSKYSSKTLKITGGMDRILLSVQINWVTVITWIAALLPLTNPLHPSPVMDQALAALSLLHKVHPPMHHHKAHLQYLQNLLILPKIPICLELSVENHNLHHIHLPHNHYLLHMLLLNLLQHLMVPSHSRHLPHMAQD